jgi:amidase
MKHILLIIALSALLFSCQNQQSPQNTHLNDFPYLEYDINRIQQGFSQGEFTIEELTQAYLDRIDKIDKDGPGLNSIIFVNPNALETARKLDAELKEGKSRGPLHGIPVVLKDNIDTYDMPTTAGSRALRNSYPPEDSYITKKLREAGCVIIAKANLSEWANFRGELSSSGWSGLGGQTHNPYDLTRNPCGSSSGSGVAVSANLTVLAIGTETNGSIVCPSTSNGVVGIKPTVGLLSRSGIIPISFTQDTPGPMARTLTDAVICLGAMTGIDSADSKTLDGSNKGYSDYTQFLKEDALEGKRIGLFKAPFGVNYKVDSLTMSVVRLFKEEGAEVIEIDNILAEQTGYHSFQLMLFEYKDGLNKYFESLGPEVPIKSVEELIEFNKKDSIELRYYNQKYLVMASEKGGLDSDEYLTALEKARLGSQKNGIDRVMDELTLDAIIAPTGSPAWKTDWTNGDSYVLGSSSPAAIAGYPNITIPMGFIEGLPVGISIFGRAWSEPKLIEIAYSFEQRSKVRIAPEFKNANY